MPSSACLQQNIPLTNQSTGATSYAWDFCGGDLTQSPTASVLVNDFGGYGIRVEIIESNDEYFGFFTSGGTRALFRLSFGSDLSNTPVSTNLGGVGISSNQIRGIDVVEDGGLFYAFLVDSDKGKIYRVDFGNSLMNAPQDAVEVYSGGYLNTPYQITSVSDGALKYLFVTNQADGNLVRLKFDTYGGAVAEAKKITILPYWLNAVSFLKAGDTWHCGSISPLTGEFVKIDFLNGLDDESPATSFTTLPAPMSAELVNENGKFYAFVQTRNSTFSLFRLDFGNAMDSPPQSTTEIPSIGYQGAEIWNLSIYNSKSTWAGFATESTGANIFRLSFPNNCFSTTTYTEDFEPKLVSSNSGSFVVSLTAKDAQGNASYLSRSLSVSTDNSSDIDFSSQNICSNHDVNFTSSGSSTDITSYSWQFGDVSTSTDQNPTHQYSSSGDYVVQLDIESNNGCSNHVEKAIKIYDPPSAAFSLPSGLICTNNEFTFLNTTPDNFNGDLSYQWLVNGSVESTSRDLKYTFTAASDYQVQLVTSIPGCSDDDIQAVQNIQLGPVVGFTITGQCQAEVVSFTNTSSGISNNWDFGNGNTSTQTSPTEVYSAFGNYDVTLETSASNGCVSKLVKNLTIYTKPQPDFSIDLPPFSCSGTPSQFVNTTASPTDSNVTSWIWNFGDAASGSSSDKNPLYTFSDAGDYDVELTAISNYGCTGTTTQTTTIAQGPLINFSYSPACFNQGTRFTDQSGTDITSWFWQIGNSTYSYSNPTHVFNATGNQSARLTVTSDNDCVATLTKTINVPVPPELDFTYSNACEGQPTTFQNTSPVAADALASQAWDFAGNIKNGSPVEYTFSTADTYAVKMISTQQSGCIYSISKNVVISPSPVAKFSANPEWGTAPLKVEFTNQSQGATNYLWQFNDKNKSTSIAVSPSFQFVDLGDYVVDLLATNMQGCTTTTSSKISVIVPSVDLELKDLNLIKDGTTGVYRIMVTIKNRSNFTLNSTDVIVDISGNARIKETLTSTILPDGEVSLLLTNQVLPGSLFTYLCAELDITADVDVLNNKKCEPVSSEGVIFQPYPNPSNGQFQFDWISLAAGDVHFSISNSTGQIVFQQDASSMEGGLNQAVFDLRSYNTGTYFFKFVSDSGSKTIPIVILR